MATTGIAISAVCFAGVKKPVAKGGLKVSKPRAKAGGLGVKKMATKVDDSVFEQAPAEPVVAALAAPTLVRSRAHLFALSNRTD